MTTENLAEISDLLYGAASIAAFLNIRQRQAYHLIESYGLPTFKVGGKVCARRSTLNQWAADRETASVKAEKSAM
jgi:excisionase family DNA binding protein